MQAESKPKAHNIDIGIMRTDIETMIKYCDDEYGGIDAMKDKFEFYYLLLKTYEVEIEYKYRLMNSETKPIDFFERGAHCPHIGR